MLKDNEFVKIKKNSEKLTVTMVRRLPINNFNAPHLLPFQEISVQMNFHEWELTCLDVGNFNADSFARFCEELGQFLLGQVDRLLK